MKKRPDQAPSSVNDLSPAILKRMQHIERCLLWRGELQRADLINEFGINPIQASNDFRAYLSRFPDSMEYNGKLKRYVPLRTFTPKLITPTTLDEFVSMSSPSVPVAVWPLPNRNASPEVLQAMISAVRDRKKIEVLYQSMTGEQPNWRFLSPHAFASDNDRWHVRAYCHSRNEFRDFVLGRILVTRHIKPSDAVSTTDTDWHTMIEVLITPNPGLQPEQRRAIAAEYVLPPDSLELTMKIRKSMLFYLKAKFEPIQTDSPAAHQLFVGQVS
ncbi:MAG: hypothetical protein JWL63_1522 [Rhodocyclales bacterium]|nr:hypothetical protein [Rhodocyclales bacterium]